MRTLLFGSAIALVIVVGMKGFADTAGSSAATTARGQTLFGMNAPSLDALDEAESTIGARAAIVGTFADWAHTPAFPRELAEAINERGAVPLISWEPWTLGAAAPTSRSTRSAGSSPVTTIR